MAAGNYSVFRPKNVDSFKFGDTAWTPADWSSLTVDLATSFATNNADPLMDAVGELDTLSPVKSAAFAKSISFSGNERDVTEDNLLGADVNGTQNQETADTAPSLQEVTLTCVYRNNVPASIFNDTTKCAMMQIDNSESSGTGVVTMAFNNIKVTHVGSITMNDDGLMEQTIKFKHKGGTTNVLAIDTTGTTWSRVNSADYSEEVRLT